MAEGVSPGGALEDAAARFVGKSAAERIVLAGEVAERLERLREVVVDGAVVGTPADVAFLDGAITALRAVSTAD